MIYKWDYETLRLLRLKKSNAWQVLAQTSHSVFQNILVVMIWKFRQMWIILRKNLPSTHLLKTQFLWECKQISHS